MALSNTSQLDPTMQMYNMWGKDTTTAPALSGVTASMLGYTNQNMPTTGVQAGTGGGFQPNLSQLGVGSNNDTGVEMPSSYKPSTPTIQAQTKPQNLADVTQPQQKSGTATNQPIYGSMGNIYTKQRDELPDWMQSQWSQRQGESSTDWVSPANYKDRNGNEFIQVGDPDKQEAGAFFKDRSKVTYDPEFGWITSPDNFQGADPGPFYKDPYFWAWAGITGLGLGMQGGLGELFGGGAEAGGGAVPSGGEFVGPPSPFDPGTPYFTGPPAPWEPGGAGPIPGTEPIPQLPPGSAADTLPPMANTPNLGGGPWQTIKDVANNPFVRRGAGALVSSLLNNGDGGQGNMPGGGVTDAGLQQIIDLISGGAAAYQGNRNIQTFKDMSENYMNRGDYNREYRPGYLSSLNESYTNPDKFLAPYAEGDARDLENMRMKLNSRGYGMSGNELGELTKYQGELRNKHLTDYRNDIRESIKLGNPDQMAAAGLRNLPFLFQAMTDRDAGNLAGLQRFYGGLQPGGKSIYDLIKEIYNGGGGGEGEDGGTEIFPPDTGDEFVGPPEDGWNYGPGNIGDDSDIWDSIFGGIG